MKTYTNNEIQQNFDLINYMAIACLDNMGIQDPNEDEIESIELMLRTSHNILLH